MNDTERIRLLVFSAILFFILTLQFTTDTIIKLFELIFDLIFQHLKILIIIIIQYWKYCCKYSIC